jgi:hypothetical protein
LGEAALNVTDPFSTDTDNEPHFDATTRGSLKMGQKLPRNWDVRASFFRLPRTGRVVIDPSLRQIDLRPSKREDRFLTSASVKPQNNEQRKVEASTAQIAIPNYPPLLSRANGAARHESKA